MRVLKFDAPTIAPLQTLGFEIADDKEVGKVAGAMTVEIIRPEHTKHEFWLMAACSPCLRDRLTVTAARLHPPTNQRSYS
jgi:hypothetical protein